MPRDCQHGRLARSCELCERDERIAELESEVERWRKQSAAYEKRIRELRADIARVTAERDEAVRKYEGWQSEELARWQRRVSELREALEDALEELREVAPMADEGSALHQAIDRCEGALAGRERLEGGNEI